MNDKLPANLLKPRLLEEIPRSSYVIAPKLKSNSESDRKSFLSLLRRGPSSSDVGKSRAPEVLDFSCATWVHMNQEITNNVSLVIHYKDAKEEYCVLVDETNPSGSNSVMLSGHAIIRPSSEITFIKASLVGVPEKCHIHVDDFHCDVSIKQNSDTKRKAS